LDRERDYRSCKPSSTIRLINSGGSWLMRFSLTGSSPPPQVASAFRRVPRHLFAPEVPLEEAYRANDSIRIKRDAQGATTSAISAPYLHAVMLEQAHITPGMRCLEIGSGGYNAALIAELAGPGGQVTTVDIDADIVQRACERLAAAGYPPRAGRPRRRRRRCPGVRPL